VCLFCVVFVDVTVVHVDLQSLNALRLYAQVMYVPGGKWRFFARFNHASSHVHTRWFQLEEGWMAKYLKPAFVKDMHENAPAWKRVPASLTGSKGKDSKILKCVKQVQAAHSCHCYVDVSVMALFRLML
jgi:hypothetical protein